MIYGYLRVSSDTQDVNSQKLGVDQFAAAHGWKIEKYITDEGVSGGKSPDKRNLGPMLRKVKKDDIIICSEISRLGRDLYMVMDILHHCMEVGCVIYTVKDRFVLGDDIQSKVLAFAFGLSAEIERQMIRQRTIEGIRRRINIGVLMGRPPRSRTSVDKRLLSDCRDAVEKMLERGASYNAIARALKCNRDTLARMINVWGITPEGRSTMRAERDMENSRRKRRKNSKPLYKDGPWEIVDLPKDKVMEWIRQGLTIPQISERLPEYSYYEVYDTISCDDDMHLLYREHAQKKLVKNKTSRMINAENELRKHQGI